MHLLAGDESGCGVTLIFILKFGDDDVFPFSANSFHGELGVESVSLGIFAGEGDFKIPVNKLAMVSKRTMASFGIRKY